MVREFNLVNEKGQKYSLMNIKTSCLLTDPNGLGYSYVDEYEQLGNTFISNLRKIEQGRIEGILNFLSYQNYKTIIDFIEGSQQLKFEYKIPLKEGERTFFKDIELQSIGKSEIKPNGVISESIVFNCLTLWYSSNTAQFEIVEGTNEIRWDFIWDSRFIDYTHRSLTYVNNGHTEAPIEVSISGEVINPQIELYVEGTLMQVVPFNITIQRYEKLLYGTKENNFYLLKQEGDGTTTDIFNLSVVEFNNDNVIRLPKDKSSEIRLVAENDISSAEVNVFSYYKAV